MEIYLGMMRFQISSVLHEITLRSSYLSSLFVYRRILERFDSSKNKYKSIREIIKSTLSLSHSRQTSIAPDSIKYNFCSTNT